MTPRHRQWYQCSGDWPGGGERYLDRAGLAAEMHEWRYPLHFIDFETSTVPISVHARATPREGCEARESLVDRIGLLPDGQSIALGNTPCLCAFTGFRFTGKPLLPVPPAARVRDGPPRCPGHPGGDRADRGAVRGREPENLESCSRTGARSDSSARRLRRTSGSQCCGEGEAGSEGVPL